MRAAPRAPEGWISRVPGVGGVSCGVDIAGRIPFLLDLSPADALHALGHSQRSHRQKQVVIRVSIWHKVY
jgi:hypothetical protein